jgi:hypothetical protein
MGKTCRTLAERKDESRMLIGRLGDSYRWDPGSKLLPRGNWLRIVSIGGLSDSTNAHMLTMWCIFKMFCIVTVSPLKPNDNGVAVGGDHERDGAQEQEKAENEENNAGERGDGQY